MSNDVLLYGLLQGRLPGRGREFYLYYLELTGSQLHIFDGQDTSDTRMHLLSVRLGSSDVAGIETKVRKGSGEFRFFLERPRDGKYLFKVMQEAVRDEWIEALQRVINREALGRIEGFQTPPQNAFAPENVGTRVMNPTRVETPTVPTTPKTPPPSHTQSTVRGRTSTGSTTSVLRTQLPPTPGGNSPRASVISTDSGIGTSAGAEVNHRTSMHKGSSSVPNSGSGTFNRGGPGGRSGGKGHSADAEFSHRVADIHANITVSEEDTPKWFWGTMSRQECEDQLKEKGEIGNFVVRVNATGHHIMSFWRVDGVHHHKILHHEGLWRFEKAAVSAEGESLADLLDTYMKNCTKDKNIKPFGGGLFENYTYAWTPQEFDMSLLEKKLKQQKEQREKAKMPRKKAEYTPVEVDTGLDDEKGGFENDDEQPAMKMKSKNKPLPLPPTNKAGSKSPKPSESLKHKAATLGRPVAGGGMALMQEFASKKGKVKSSDTARKHSPPSKNASTSLISAQSQEAEPEQAEPLYANTAPPSDAPYQNMEFDGPPPPSAAKGKTGKASPAVSSKKSASDLAGAASSLGSAYQNYSFDGKKQPPPAAKKPGKVGAHMNGSTSPKLANTSPMSLQQNNEGIYQNTAFTKPRR